MSLPDTPPANEVNPDAINRSWRTLLQGLLFDVLAAVSLVFLPLITGAETWGDLDWKTMGFLLAKTVVVAGFSYLMRHLVQPNVP